MKTNRIFMDTEFIEGPQPKKILGIKTGKFTKPTIDLISIGMINEHGETYYAISNEFNLDFAWENEWVRSNVLYPMYKQLFVDDKLDFVGFNKTNMKKLIQRGGKSNRDIANELQDFMITHFISDGIYSFNGARNWVILSSLTNMTREIKDVSYCKDLKQILDASVLKLAKKNNMSHDSMLQEVKTWSHYPKQTNEHNALADAQWNKDLFDFIGTIA